jgi:hypothetical protein
MAYIDRDKKKQLLPQIKYVLNAHGFKGTVAVRDYSTLVVTLSEGSLDLIEQLNNANLEAAAHVGGTPKHIEGFCSLNPCTFDNGFLKGRTLAFLIELREAMNNGNHNYDAVPDYYNVGWYVEINVGRWNKPYKFTGTGE